MCLPFTCVPPDVLAKHITSNTYVLHLKKPPDAQLSSSTTELGSAIADSTDPIASFNPLVGVGVGVGVGVAVAVVVAVLAIFFVARAGRRNRLSVLLEDYGLVRTQRGKHSSSHRNEG